MGFGMGKGEMENEGGGVEEDREQELMGFEVVDEIGLTSRFISV